MGLEVVVDVLREGFRDSLRRIGVVGVEGRRGCWGCRGFDGRLASDGEDVVIRLGSFRE